MSSDTTSEKYNKPELIKNKYYRAEDADYIFDYLSSENDRITEENQKLRKIVVEFKKRNDELKQRSEENEESVTVSKKLARQIISEANTLAERTVADAERRADAIVRNAVKEAKTIRIEAMESAEENYQKNAQEVSIMRAAESFARIKEQQLRLVDNINLEWKKLLLDYYGDSADETGAFERVNVPLDLSDKIDAIANQLKLIEFDDEE